MVDSGGTLVTPPTHCSPTAPRKSPPISATALLSGGAAARITGSKLKELVITDSIQPHRGGAQRAQYPHAVDRLADRGSHRPHGFEESVSSLLIELVEGKGALAPCPPSLSLIMVGTLALCPSTNSLQRIQFSKITTVSVVASSLRAKRSNPFFLLRLYGLLRCARNDVQTHVYALAAQCARAVDESSAP